MAATNVAFFAHESAYIDPPCQIGEGTEIGHFSHVMTNSRIGRDCRIGQHVVIPPGCVIGNGVSLHDNVVLLAGAVLEDDVVCGASVVLATAALPRAGGSGWPSAPPGLIQTGARIGANATVFNGSVIGRYSLVEAGTVVTRNVPNYAIVSGNPMRIAGWLCHCGARLDFGAGALGGAADDDPAGAATAAGGCARPAVTACEACGRSYSRQGSVVEETGHDEQAAVSVPLLDLKPQYAALEAEISAALRDVCASQQFILGPRVARFERRVADYCQSAFGVGVSSGTDALLLALMALDVGPGDEVITTPYSFFATAGTIARLGARPLFCDIDPQTYNISADAVSRLIETQCAFEHGRLVNTATGGAVKALLPVHLFGLCADMDALCALAQRYGMRVVEDAAQAIGAEDAAGRRAGSFGDIGCFSFFPSKNLGAFGDAGLCTTSDPELAERMRVLRVHGAEPKYYHALVGGNFRIDALQAAVLDVKLDYLDRWTAQRQRNAAFYTEAFAQIDVDDQLSTPWQPAGFRHVYNQYTLRVRQRDELRAFLADAAIGTEIYYPVPLHQQRCFDYLGCDPDAYPEANAAAAETLALPIYPELSDVQKKHVVASVLALLR